MMVTSGVLVILFCGFVAAKPSPQFLPVAVQLDQPYHAPYTLKTTVKVTDKHNESNRSVPYKLKATVKVRDDKENDIASEGHNDIVVSSSDLLLSDSEVSSTAKSTTESAKSLDEVTSIGDKIVKKRTRSRPKGEPKDSKKIIFSRSSLWHLKTINDKPAEEVLVTDKASVARDLKDSTESALIKVKNLDEE